MSKINDLFHRLADEAREPPEDILAGIARLKARVTQRNRQIQDNAQDAARINEQRDQLLSRIADILGIPMDEYGDFFDNIQ